MTETSTWSSLLGHPRVHSGQPDDRWMVTYPRGLLVAPAVALADEQAPAGVSEETQFILNTFAFLIWGALALIVHENW